TSNGYPQASSPASVRITSVPAIAPRNGSDTLSVTFTRPHGRGCGMAPGRRDAVLRCPVPLDAGGANGWRGWSNSLETTVARTMISATGTSQLLGLLPEQEQASACNAHNVNA